MAMALPSDWNFSVPGMAAICKEGKSAIYTAIKELIEYGYAKRTYVYGDVVKDGVPMKLRTGVIYSLAEKPTYLNSTNLNLDNLNQDTLNLDKCDDNNKVPTKSSKKNNQVKNEEVGANAPQTTTSPLIEKNSFNWSLVKESLTAEQADAAVRDLLSDPQIRTEIIQKAMWSGTPEELDDFITKFCALSIEQYNKKIKSPYTLKAVFTTWLGKERHFATPDTHRFDQAQFKTHYEGFVSKIPKLSPEAKQELLNRREGIEKYIQTTLLPKLNGYKFLSAHDGLSTRDFAYLMVKYNKQSTFKVALECIETIATTKKYSSFRRLIDAIDKAYEDAKNQK